MKRILLSGGFDPVHPGHIAMFNAAQRYGHVIVALNSDAWLTRKKGKPFMRWGDRAAVLQAIRYVDEIVAVNDHDGTVCEAIRLIRPDYFGNGGDRNASTTPSAELILCAELGVQPVFELANTPHHSSDIIASGTVVERAWGTYQVLYEGHNFKVKKLVVNPDGESSLQRHDHRHEVWCYPTGLAHTVRPREWHRLHNPGRNPLHMIEVQVGIVLDESDIERRAP